ncbi:hypothetical protein DFJ58DRAFT_849021 [Suillus subalutaceus]|uniref:uncharacterized protein n=1 Tax=Suillus subalutaceus TaxID=48586 RepID=UPI001B87A580|nr:uncharacterized protein DFJ58DRAFT_849021 [Suillus subalutaceus]KAG1828588.1 hypothetical protein DFJ58DRAFT_849021 [Suillus subalutaceus]
MSDIFPPQYMIPPAPSLSYPELRYNDAGNAFACNNVGAWVPHPGICNALTSQRSFRMESVLASLCARCQGNDVINPVLLPLPDSGDLDLTDAITIAEARGHIPAAKTADVNALLDMVQDELPLGQHGWQTVHLKYSQWAKVNHRPSRKITSLETKYKQLVKTTKPIGDGVCPPQTDRWVKGVVKDVLYTGGPTGDIYCIDG